MFKSNSYTWRQSESPLTELLFCLTLSLSATQDAFEKDVAHRLRQLPGIGVDSRIVPGVKPIHHAEQTEHRNARRELQSPVALQFVEQSHADAIVFALDGRHFRGKTVLQRVRLVRKHFHGGLACKKILQVIEDENTNPLLRIVHALQALLQPLHDG